MIVSQSVERSSTAWVNFPADGLLIQVAALCNSCEFTPCFALALVDVPTLLDYELNIL